MNNDQWTAWDLARARDRGWDLARMNAERKASREWIEKFKARVAAKETA